MIELTKSALHEAGRYCKIQQCIVCIVISLSIVEVVRRMISRVVLTTFPIFFVSPCQSGLLIWGNAASLSIDVDIPNKVLFLTYEFESPVRAAKFLNTPERARNSSWSVLDSEIELNGNVLTRIDSRPFQRATIKVGIEEDSTKQGESALSAIGDVGLFYLVRIFGSKELR